MLTFLRTPEPALPVKRPLLVARLLDEPWGGRRAWFAQVAEMLAARFHFEYRRRLEELKAAYDPFEPDGPAAAPAGDASVGHAAFSQAYAALLAAANYTELSRKQIVACIECQTRGSLAIKANLDDYAELRAFYRGVRAETRLVRSALRPWRLMDETVHVFGRVALLVRTRRDPSGRVHLKVFKNVVAEDLEMLLPSVRVCMRWRDRLKIGSSFAGGLATAGWKLFTAAILSTPVFLMVLFTFLTAGVRGVLSFFSSKTHYLQTISSNLYFQNIANNEAALATLVASAEEEEIKEALLALALLSLEGPLSREQLDRRCEAWLAEKFGFRLDFDLADAVRKLTEKQLLLETPGEGAVLAAVDLPTAALKLDRIWDGYFSPPENAGQPVGPAIATAAEAAAPGEIRRVDAAEPAATPATRAAAPLLPQKPAR